jgi:putative DNA primase/helicase
MIDHLMASAVGDAARAACSALELDYRSVAADGRFHRLSVNGRGKDGSLCLFADGLGGIAWNFKTGEHRLFFAEGPAGLSDAERRKLQRQLRECQRRAEQLRQAGYDAAARRAQRLWQRLSPAPPSHPYLLRKGVKPHGARIFRGTLIVPVINGVQEMTSVQLIAPNGTRRFLNGGRVAGGFYVLGDATATPEFILAEGFATAASLREATGRPIVVAFFAGNLAAVTEFWRQTRPDARIIIAADDDWKTEGNPGVTKAQAAASRFGALIAIPVFAGVTRTKNDTDFNDIARLLGPGAVRQQIETVLAGAAPRLRRSGHYEATGQGLYITRETRHGSERQRLANFTAWVVAERIVDDGAEWQKTLCWPRPDKRRGAVHGHRGRNPGPQHALHDSGRRLCGDELAD